LAALRDRGPYPVLALFGEHGTTKSTFAKILRSLIDPNVLPLRTLSRDERDLFIAATNGRVLVFDNISFLADWISDTLCRLSTGGGFATRQLYSDQDEVLLDATRPVILNGIEEVVNRPDLADRAIFLTLEPIPDDKRRLETELWAAFELMRPRVLGALLDAVALGLERLPKTRLKTLPRMADFAVWATACETALRHQDGTSWQEGAFAKAYAGNIDEAVESVLEANSVATAVRTLMANQTEWAGTATDLLDLLGKAVGEKATRAKAWPADATRLGGRLRRAATFLRKVGIEIDIGKRQGHARTRTITLSSNSQQEGEGDTVSAVSAKTNGDATARSATGASGRASVHDNPLKSNNKTAAAAADAELPSLTDSEKRGVPGLSDGQIRELVDNALAATATELEETGDVDQAALERRLRENLAIAGIPPEIVEGELGRIMEALAVF
jgi:hypothetical protein